MKKLLVALLIVVAAVIGWAMVRRNRPPVVNFVRAERRNIVSTLPTNGKVEPLEWQAVRAEMAGVIREVPVREGGPVAQGATLAVMDDTALQAEVDAATARVAEARANMAAAEAGGTPAEITELDNSVSRAKLDLQQAQREYESLRRLVEKQAATPAEANAALDKVRQAEAEIAGLEKRRNSFKSQPQVAAARARLDDAEAGLKLARQKASQTVIRTPVAGVVYQLAARPGSFIEAGGLIANVGRMDQIRVRLYVDEPELGRVHQGDAVTITWDALQGKQWQGKVDRMPTTIQPLGSRQVGEVLCAVGNAGGELPAGANVNAEIRTASADSVTAIPKETMRRDAAGDFVFALATDHIERRKVQTGVSSVSYVQITSGLNPGDAVAQPGETPLQPGMPVTPSVR